MAEIIEDILSQEEDTQKGKYLIFFIGNEEYGIEIRYVTEIIGIQSITPIPELPQYVKGVINLRGKIIPVMDVRLRFRKAEREYDERTCIIVIEIKDISIGLVIDRVSEVVDIADSEITPPPNVGSGFHHKYIQGIGKVENGVKLLLDCDKLLNDDEIDIINEAI